MKKVIAIIILIPYIAWAYTPPRGIPAPTFGIDEDVDDYIGKEYNFTDGRGTITYPISVITGSPFTHYVDMSHGSATDASNDYGTEAKPRLTIPNAFTAGSVIEIHNGTYDTKEQFTSQAGTLASPTFIRGDPSSMPVYETARTGDKFLIFLGTCAYTIIENIDFDGSNGACVFLGGESSYMCVRNCEVQNKNFTNTSSLLIAQASEGDTVSNIVFYNNTIHDIGSYTTASDDDFHGIVASMDGRNTGLLTEVWMVENTGYRISGNLCQINAGNGDHSLIQYVYIGSNTAYTNRQAGVGIKESTHVIVSENTFYDSHEYSDGNPGGGITFQYAPDNLWIIFNTLYGNTYGVRSAGTRHSTNNNAYIIGNLIYDNLEETQDGAPHFGHATGFGIATWSTEQNHYIIGNTIYNCPGGMHLVRDVEHYVYNNLISDIANVTDYGHMVVDESADSGKIDSDYNLFYQTASSTRFLWGAANPPAEYRTLATFQAAVAEEQNSVEGDPLFTASNTDDYTLGAGSPAIDTALYKSTVKTVFDLFESNYGISIRYDLDGNDRSNVVWDIGAYERDGGATVGSDGLLEVRRDGRRNRRNK